MRRRFLAARRATTVATLAAAALVLAPPVGANAGQTAGVAEQEAHAAPAQTLRSASGNGQRLSDFLAEALRRSPRLHAARNAYDQAAIGRDLAAARFNSRITPFFTATNDRYGSAGPGFGVDFSRVLPTGTTLRFRADSFAYDLGTTSYRDSGYALDISHPLLAAFGPEPRYELTNARRAVETATLSLRETRQRLVLEVAQGYFNIVRQQRLVAASEVALERAERLKTASEARMQVGLATRLDVLRADLFTSQAQASLEDRRTALADAEDLLKLVTGRSLSAALAVAGDDLDEFTRAYELLPTDGGALVRRLEHDADPIDATMVFDFGSVSADAAAAVTADTLRPFVATALGTRIDVQEARARVGDADRAVSVATWRMLPEIRLDASYRQRGFWSQLAPGLADPFGGVRIGLTTSYTLDRSAERAAFSSAGIAVRAAERALVDLQQQVVAEVRRAHRAILRADKAIAIHGKTVELSETQLELAQLRYERGLADNFDVVDAESNVFEAMSALVSARVDRALAGLALDLAMGLVDPDRYGR